MLYGMTSKCCMVSIRKNSRHSTLDMREREMTGELPGIRARNSDSGMSRLARRNSELSTQPSTGTEVVSSYNPRSAQNIYFCSRHNQWQKTTAFPSPAHMGVRYLFLGVFFAVNLTCSFPPPPFFIFPSPFPPGDPRQNADHGWKSWVHFLHFGISDKKKLS